MRILKKNRTFDLLQHTRVCSWFALCSIGLIHSTVRSPFGHQFFVLHIVTWSPDCDSQTIFYTVTRLNWEEMILKSEPIKLYLRTKDSDKSRLPAIYLIGQLVVLITNYLPTLLAKITWTSTLVSHVRQQTDRFCSSSIHKECEWSSHGLVPEPMGCTTGERGLRQPFVLKLNLGFLDSMWFLSAINLLIVWCHWRRYSSTGTLKFSSTREHTKERMTSANTNVIMTSEKSPT